MTRQTARHALLQANQHAGDTQAGDYPAAAHDITGPPSVIFRRDFCDLPAFRQTVRVRGWIGLHLRAPAGIAGRETESWMP